MLAKSPVIVLGSVKYGDSSIIVRTYSRDYGLISFIAGGTRSKRGPLRPVMVQPLSQLEVVFYDKSKSELKRIKEAGIIQSYRHILFNPVKNCISLFIAEVLGFLLHGEEISSDLYDFVSRSAYALDEMEEGVANFHLIFLYRLTTFLGFKPEEPREADYFDLLNGTYSTKEPLHHHYIKGGTVKNWQMLKNADYGIRLELGSNARRELLKAVLEYYRLHIRDFGELKSLDILHEVLH